MLAINPISAYKVSNYKPKGTTEVNIQNKSNGISNSALNSYPLNYYTKNISFGDRITSDVKFETYKEMTDEEKEILRTKYKDFHKLVKNSELFTPKNSTDNLPLYSEEEMDKFIEFSSLFNKYKENHIICLGRSPKWFLNASIWMKDGIENYTLASFSKNWYGRNGFGVGKNLYRKDSEAPNLEQKNAYFKYMKSIKCDPKSLVRKAKKLQRPIIITDYIHSGCGVTSYLDLMSEFAEKQDCLEDFAKSIKLVTFGSEAYIDELGYCPAYDPPRVLMPERLKPYEHIIEQEYHDMSAKLLKDILINKNTNECRATYYPPEAWTQYNPKKYRTGMPKEGQTIPIHTIKRNTVERYTDAMRDYRSLMEFRILDALAQRGKLKDEHRTR